MLYFQEAICRRPDNFSSWFLRPFDHQEVVGAVRQAALARQSRHVPPGPRQGVARRHHEGEDQGGGGDEAHRDQARASLLHPLYPGDLREAEAPLPRPRLPCPVWAAQTERGREAGRRVVEANHVEHRHPLREGKCLQVRHLAFFFDNCRPMLQVW